MLNYDLRASECQEPYPSMKQDFIRDTDLKGFAVRVTKGKSVFVVEQRVNGRVARHPIGPYGKWTPELARDKAKQFLRQMDNGVDPRIEKKKAKRRAHFSGVDLILYAHPCEPEKVGRAVWGMAQVVLR